MGLNIPIILIALLSIPIFLFTLFPLISSTSNGLKGIYIFSYLWNDQVKPTTYLHVGYYGICWTNFQTTGPSCISTGSKSAKAIVNKIFGTNADQYDNDVAIVQVVLDLQHKVFVAFMTAGGLAWFFSLVLIAVVILTKGRAGGIVRLAATIMGYVGAVLMFASAWSTTTGVRALEVAQGKAGGFTGGTLLIALQWVAAILASIFAWAVARLAGATRKEEVYSYNMGGR